MLKLDARSPPATDVSSLRTVIHAAAPCPVEIKRQMIDWWGPLISEFYSSSEGRVPHSSPPRTGWSIPARWAADARQPRTSWTSGTGGPARSRPGRSGSTEARSSSTTTIPDKTAEAITARLGIGDVGYLDEDG